MYQAELIIIGGANGSGKTTLAREIVSLTGINYLGADEIAVQINKISPEKAAIFIKNRLIVGIYFLMPAIIFSRLPSAVKKILLFLMKRGIKNG